MADSTIRAEITREAYGAARTFARTTRGANIIRDVRFEDDHSFTIVTRDGQEIHFTSIEIK